MVQQKKRKFPETAPLTEHEFRRRFQMGLIAVWLIPPTTALLGMCFLGFWSLSQAGLSLLRFSGVYVVAFTLIAYAICKRQVLDPVTALADDQHAPDLAHATKLKAFPWVFWGLLSLYCGFGPATVLLSNTVFEGVEYTFEQYALSSFGVIPCLLIAAFPMFFYLTDLLGRFLAPRGVVVVVAPVWLKVAVLGLFTPVMIDVILLLYYFDRTGFLAVETLVLWSLLILTAAVGTLFAFFSFRQGMLSLKRPLGGVGGAGNDVYPVPQSLDEFGLLARGWADLLGSRDRAERKVGERDRLTREIIDNTDSVIYIKDKEGRYLLINRRYEQLFGLSNEDVLAKTDYDIFPQVTADVFRKNDLKVIGSAQPLQVQEIVSHEDGPHNYISQKFPLYDADGAIYGVCGISTDVTERRKAEKALVARERQQAVVAELGQEALAGLGLSELMDQAVHRIAQTLNVEYCKVLELLRDGESLLLRAGVGWKDGLVGSATVPADRDSQAGYTLQASEPVIVNDLTTETRFSGPSLLLDHKVVSGMSVVIHGSDGPFGALGVHTIQQRSFSDVDVNFLRAAANLLANAIQRKRAEEELRDVNITLEGRVADRTTELEEKNAELEAFAHSVSHDLRAPLRAMHGFSGALLEDHADRLGAEGREFAQRIVDAANRMDGLINDLLTYSRISRIELRLLAIDLTSVVQESVTQIESEIQARHAQIMVDSPLPQVVGHRSTLVQITTNLLTNAVKFVNKDECPRVRVWAEARNGRIRLFVEDNGIGIRHEHHDRIFQVFERLHGMETYPGTGIGLAIVRRAVERLGGAVGLESTPGEGSRFWVEFSAME